MLSLILRGFRWQILGGLGFFSIEIVSALKDHRRGGEDAHVYGLIFVKSEFVGIWWYISGWVGFFFQLRLFRPRMTIGEGVRMLMYMG